MSLQIEPFCENHSEAVVAFNQRLRHGGIRFQFPEDPVPTWLPPLDSRSLYQEFFLAVEETGAVRGGYLLKHQDFVIGDTRLSIGNFQLPLSEGTINEDYSRVGLQLLTNALKRQPLLYALGMGSKDRPLPRMLEAMGWRLRPMPFHFRVRHPQSFLKNITALRERPAWRLLSDVAAATGVGYIGILSLQASRRKKRSRIGRMAAEPVASFDTWASDLWNRCSEQYSFAAVRTKPILNVLYPPGDRRFLRLKVSIDGAVAGWAVMLDTTMKNHNYFGNMQVGSIVDCFAAPEHADAVVDAATDFLELRGVDLVISNQAHPWWCSALANAGFLPGPSNFILATSRALTREIEQVDTEFERSHINRGDGDGPIHL